MHLYTKIISETTTDIDFGFLYVNPLATNRPISPDKNLPYIPNRPISPGSDDRFQIDTRDACEENMLLEPDIQALDILRCRMHEKFL